MIRSRRHFLLSAAALSIGCTSNKLSAKATIGAVAKVRSPVVGQSWRYAKHDPFTGKTVDRVVDRVSAVGQSIEIESHSEAFKDGPITYPQWDTRWLQPYANRSRSADPLPSEVQQPWGMVLVDPHWSQLQVFEKPIPLWPQQLLPGWTITVGTNYKIPDSEEIMPWQLTMHAHRWESISVPAGQFTALRYFNLINFRYTNVSGRVAGQRKENIWFAPEVGRWVVRESSGTFRQDVAEEFNESSYRWELLDWT